MAPAVVAEPQPGHGRRRCVPDDPAVVGHGGRAAVDQAPVPLARRDRRAPAALASQRRDAAQDRSPGRAPDRVRRARTSTWCGSRCPPTGPMSSGRSPNQCSEGGATDRAPGVSRFDLFCGPRVRETCEHLVRRWAEDRALPARAVDRICVLTSAALGHGLLYQPRGVSVTMRWADVDRVRVDVLWHGCTRVSQGTVSSEKLESTVALFDAAAVRWGFGHGSPSQWMVVDSAGEGPAPRSGAGGRTHERDCCT